jgi:ectoine hydroxylase-related dioxygenase (phytanoyl-CoA dioxygenase family)
MTELYHHQAMWNNRQYPRLYDAFVDLWGTEKLWVTIDRVNMNLPNRDRWQNNGFLHWDIDLVKREHVRNIQGVLSLNDNEKDMGGLQIVPDLFKQLDNWLQSQPINRSRIIKEKLEFEVINLESKAGDLIIWDSRMAHGTSPNRSKKPRFAQYISMCPAEPEEEELLQIRLESFEKRRGPRKCGMPGSTKEESFGSMAKLTELGQRLLGSVSW